MLIVAEEAVYARAAERMNHMWARGSGVDRSLCCIRPVGADVQGYGILDREAPSA